METYSKSYPVVADCIDTRYRLSPSGVILFLQDAIASDMATWHAAAFDIAPENLLWVVLEYDINFDGPVSLWSGIIMVTVSVTELTPMRVYFDFSMSGEDGIQFAHGTSVWSLLDSVTRLPYTRTHDYVLKKSGLNPDEMIIRHPRKKNRDYGEPTSSCSYRTQRSDLDFNNHVSNRTYLSLALGCFYEEFQRNRPLSSLNVKYLKETYLDDTIECLCRNADGNYVCDMRNSAGEPVCQVSISWSETVDERDVREIVLRK